MYQYGPLDWNYGRCRFLIPPHQDMGTKDIGSEFKKVFGKGHNIYKNVNVRLDKTVVC